MSSPLQLTLTSHELFALPADTPATGPAIRVEVTPRDRAAFFALARLVMVYTNVNDRDYYRVFFRDERRPEDEIFSSGGNCIVAEKETPGEEKLLRRTTKGANSGIVTRFWKPMELPYCLDLSSNGAGNVIWDKEKHPSFLDFYWGSWNDEKSFLAWSTQEFHDFCRQLVADSDSELNFFLSWQKFSSEEKTAFATKCEYGDWELLLRLFTWVLQLIVYQFGSYPFQNRESSYWDFPREIPTHYDRPAVFFARRWQEVIYKIVRPAFWPSYPICAHQWRYRNAGPENQVFCETPTVHEYMEAQLHLRDFLRSHLSESEIEALFTP